MAKQTDTTGRIKKPAVAGSFYPASVAALSTVVDDCLHFAEKQTDTMPMAVYAGAKILIAPHAGYVFSGKTAACGYRVLQTLGRVFTKVVVVGPSHFAFFDGVAFSDYVAWETPLGKVRCAFPPDAIYGKFPDDSVLQNDYFLREHCIETQIPFLQKTLGEFLLLPVLYANIKSDVLCDILLEMNDDGTLFVISSDLSHYYSYEEARAIDSNANRAIPALDIATVEERVEACGKQGILAAIRMAQRLGLKGALLNYMNSGDTEGDKGAVVGYGSYIFYSA